MFIWENRTEDVLFILPSSNPFSLAYLGPGHGGSSLSSPLDGWGEQPFAGFMASDRGADSHLSRLQKATEDNVVLLNTEYEGQNQIV